MSKLDLIIKQLEDLKEEVLTLKNQEMYEKVDWRDNHDPIVLQGENNEWVEIECNYESWRYAKGKEHILLIDVYENEIDSSSTAINLENMIKLRDYLNEKIEYLTTDESSNNTIYFDL